MTEPNSHPVPQRDHLGRAHQPDLERDGRDHTEWDKRYAEAEQMWNGEPMALGLAEVSDLEPGSALDVGCGEGAGRVYGWRAGARGSPRSTYPTSL